MSAPEPTDWTVEEILRLGRKKPLPREQAIELAKKMIVRLRAACQKRKDTKGLKSLEGELDELAAQIVDGAYKKRTRR